MIKLGDTDRTIPNPDEDIRGRKVVDRNGEQLGKVTDLLIDDAAMRARFLIVEHGGILGIGATQSFIPVEAVTSIEEEGVQVATDLQTVAGAPVYDPEIALEPQYYENVYGYYGVTPYWTVGPDSREYPGYERRGG
jgi:sporulation protein YlmC with PRC-barrel domain